VLEYGGVRYGPDGSRVSSFGLMLSPPRISRRAHYPLIAVLRPANDSTPLSSRPDRFVASVFVRPSHRRVALSPFLLFHSPLRLSFSLFLLSLLPTQGALSFSLSRSLSFSFSLNVYFSFSLFVSSPKLQFYIHIHTHFFHTWRELSTDA